MKKKGEKLDKKTGTKKWLGYFLLLLLFPLFVSPPSLNNEVINRMLDRRRNEKERRPSVGCIYWQQSFLVRQFS
ncbi:Uncharacterized protein APZ42_021799 [Daphnia magna]|uniref:Uncharacterized protein n=1 Tax=Daphnia magna TaxID=35525 RepID=A0A0P6AQH7_9CRUS|nr:Uncharacterized protein APZ42_021799 [Daphnia magna]